MRSKEEALTTRYFPAPRPAAARNSTRLSSPGSRRICPNCPTPRRPRFMAEYGLSAYDSGVLVSEKETADYYEAAVSHGGVKRDAKGGRQLDHGRSFGLRQFARPVGGADADRRRLDRRARRPHRRGRDLRQIAKGRPGDSSSPRMATPIRASSWRRAACARSPMRRRSRAPFDAIIAPIPTRSRRRSPKPTMLGWFVGQVMKSTGGKSQSAGRQRQAETETRR